MARMKVKASPARARTSVPGDVADTMKWVKISFGGSTSRYVVHYHLDNGTGEPLKPICGSKNVNKLTYVQRIGEHVNCKKCIIKKGALRLAAANAAMAEARTAQQAKDIEKAAENVANAKPRSAPPLPVLVAPPAAPALPSLILAPAPAPVPVQRNGNGFSSSLFQAPAWPARSPVDVDDYDVDDEEDDEDDIESADEEAPQMTTRTVTPLTAFPTPPTRPVPLVAVPVVPPVAKQPAVAAAEPVVSPQAQPVEDDVIVVRSNTYDVILTHPVTKARMVIEGVQADSEDEAELFALDYVEVETVTKSTRVRAPRK